MKPIDIVVCVVVGIIFTPIAGLILFAVMLFGAGVIKR